MAVRGPGLPRGSVSRGSDARLRPQLVQDVARLQRRSLRHSRQLEAPRPYIAARFSVLPPVFHPGDQKQYGGFDNRGLEPGHRYVLFVLAVLQKSEPVSAASSQAAGTWGHQGWPAREAREGPGSREGHSPGRGRALLGSPEGGPDGARPRRRSQPAPSQTPSNWTTRTPSPSWTARRASSG